MKQVQRGFTLIELMIVVAIIGILASIAVPAYSDYTVRARVSEAASLVRAPREAVDIAFSEGYLVGGTNIPSQASLGLVAPGSYNSKYVASIAVASSGAVTVTLTGENSLGPAKNGTVVYRPTDVGGNLVWRASCSFSTRFCPRG